MKNIYMLENAGGGYRESTQSECNQLIEMGRAHWAGSDPDPHNDAVIHYADRGGME